LNALWLASEHALALHATIALLLSMNTSEALLVTQTLALYTTKSLLPLHTTSQSSLLP
jgi:hypothetical protein